MTTFSIFALLSGKQKLKTKQEPATAKHEPPAAGADAPSTHANDNNEHKELTQYHIPYLVMGLFLFYVAVMGNYIDGLIGSGMRSLLQERWMVHLVGFFILLFTISLATMLDVWNSLLMSVLLYLWFTLTTKMGKWENLSLFLLLVAGFFLQRLLQNNYSHEWAEAIPDQTDQRHKVRKNIETSIIVIFSIILVLTILGNVRYMRVKWNDPRHIAKHRQKLLPFLWYYLYLGQKQ